MKEGKFSFLGERKSWVVVEESDPGQTSGFFLDSDETGGQIWTYALSLSLSTIIREH